MKTVAILELKGEEYAVVPIKDYRKLIKSGVVETADDTLPPMPPRRANGDYGTAKE